MLTKTSLSAVRALMYVSSHGTGGFLPPRKIAEDLQESPTYMAKITRQLVKAGLLRVEKGVKGGVRLARAPESITLLAVVEACQGTLVGSYCKSSCDLDSVCGFHYAALELHNAMSGVLSKWTLAKLLKKPIPVSSKTTDAFPCVILNRISPAVFLPR